MWKFCEGVQTVSKLGLSGPVALLLLFFIALIGIPVIQSSLNEVAG